MDILRSLGEAREGVGSVQFVTRPQIHPEVFDITCEHLCRSSRCTCLSKSSPIQQASTSRQLRLNPQADGRPWKFSKRKPSPLRNSVQMELICVTGCQFSFKRKTGAPPIPRESVLSSRQRPQTATSAAGRCGRGLSLGAPAGRPLQRNCSPPFRCILTAHSAPSDKEIPRDKRTGFIVE